MNHLLINRLFSQSTVKDMTRNQESSVLNECVVNYSKNSHWENNQEALSFMYKFAAKKYRNEYFYKNTLLNKLLIGRHSLNTTTALTEFTIGKSKADFILINGKAVVYEIKTELDNLDRLDNQITDYYKAFDHVCIVTSGKHFNKIYEKYKNTTVGICVLTDRETISTKKECIENRESLEYESLFKVLRKYEFEDIIFQQYGYLPETSQFIYYKECFKLFEKIDINNLYEQVLVLLKQRVKLPNTKKFLNEIPYELKSLIYFSDYNELEYEKLLNFLKSEIKEEE